MNSDMKAKAKVLTKVLTKVLITITKKVLIVKLKAKANKGSKGQQSESNCKRKPEEEYVLTNQPNKVKAIAVVKGAVAKAV
jgi:hypothetical protein